MCHVSDAEFAAAAADARSFRLLELAANDDLEGLQRAVEEAASAGAPASACASWYCRQIGSSKMASVERTPIMIAALFGSVKALCYLLEHLEVHGGGDVNCVCGVDKATALHCALASGTRNSADVVQLLLKHGADPALVSSAVLRSSATELTPRQISSSEKASMGMDKAACAKPGSLSPDPVASAWKGMLPDSVSETSFEDLEESLKSLQDAGAGLLAWSPKSTGSALSAQKCDGQQDRSPSFDGQLSDVKSAIFSTDEFRMYSFKVRPCSRAYSHDWTECPFAHPGENARRRDPRRFHYSCVPCPEFRKGACKQGDACEYAHGVFESWLHPAQYRTRLCKDGTSCSRKVCFFAHVKEEVRPLYVSAECGIGTGTSPCPSPSSIKAPVLLSGGMNLGPSSPSLMGCAWTQPGLPALRLPEAVAHSRKMRASLSARDMAVDRELTSLSAQARINAAVVASSNSFAISPAHDRKIPSFGSSLSSFEDSIYNVVSPRSPLQMVTQSSPRTGSSFYDGSAGNGVLEEMLAALAANRNASAHSRSLYGQYDDWAHMGILGSGKMTSPLPSASPSSHAEAGFLQKRRDEISACLSPARKEEQAWLDWGSPTGKLEWGVSGDDLAHFRKSYSCKA